MNASSFDRQQDGDLLDASISKPLEGGASYTFGHRFRRLVWSVTWALVARWTPPNFSPWRIFLLRLFGAKVDRTAAVAASTRIWYPPNLTMRCHATLGPEVNCYNMAEIEIGDGAIVSQGAFLCCGSHNIRDAHFQLTTKPIKIEARSWVCAEAFVGPGVVVGEGAVLAARGAAFRSLDPWSVYVGNPASKVSARVIEAES